MEKSKHDEHLNGLKDELEYHVFVMQMRRNEMESSVLNKQKH